MRNLTKHPITIKEICACLDECSAEALGNEAVGDMRPLLLRTASKILQRLEFATFKIGQGL